MPYHPSSGTCAILTLLPRFPNFHPREGHEGPALATLSPGKTQCTHCTGGRVGHSASLDWCRKSNAHTWIQSPNHSAHTESKYPCYEGVWGEKRYSSTLTLALYGSQWPTLCPSWFSAEKVYWYSLIEGWVGPGPCLGILEKRRIFPYQDSNPGPSIR